MKAKKSLGQHFLRSEKALASILKAGEVREKDTILEIGPGKGVLTEKLLANDARLIAIEKDDELYKELGEKFKKEISNKQLNLIHDDILDFDTSGLENYKLIANIPYNITGAIFKKFLETDNQPERMVLLIQREVAERIVTRDKKESILSLSVKAYGNPRYVELVKAGSFVPMPKVDSAIIAVENISKNFFKNFSEEKFFKVLKAGFSSKRKKLSSNLSSIFEKNKVLETFKKLKLDQNLRAEDTSIEIWGKMAEEL